LVGAAGGGEDCGNVAGDGVELPPSSIRSGAGGFWIAGGALAAGSAAFAGSTGFAGAAARFFVPGRGTAQAGTIGGRFSSSVDWMRTEGGDALTCGFAIGIFAALTATLV